MTRYTWCPYIIISPVSQVQSQIAYQKQYVLHHKLKYLNIRVDIVLYVCI